MALSKRQKHLNKLIQSKRNARLSMQASLPAAATSNQENPAAEDPMRSVPDLDLESGSKATTEKRKLDTTEDNDFIDLSVKRQAMSQLDHSMSEILHTLPRLPAHFDDSDVSSTLDSDASDDWDDLDDLDRFMNGSDVSDEAEINPDDETSFKANNNAEDVKTAVLEWHPGAGKFLRESYGSGSRATLYRQKQRQDSLQREASKCYSIKELFKRQEDRNVARQTTDEAHEVTPLSRVGLGKSVEATVEDARSKASMDLKRLVELSTEQTKKYGYILSKNSDFFKRHTMLLSFLWVRQKRENFPGVKLGDLARMVATNYNKGTGYARNLIIWERSWTENRSIPQRKSRKSSANVSWMNEEDISCAARDFVKTQGEGKFLLFSLWKAISLTFLRNHFLQAGSVRF